LLKDRQTNNDDYISSLAEVNDTRMVVSAVGCIAVVCVSQRTEFGGRWFQSAGHCTQSWTLRRTDVPRKGAPSFVFVEI